MDIKSYIDLTESQKRILYKFIRAVNRSSSFDSITEMDNDYGGAASNFGLSHYSIWEDNKVLGTLGLIDKDFPVKGDVYITAVCFQEENLKLLPILFQHSICHSSYFSSGIAKPVVKLGIAPNNSFMIPEILQLGFSETYRVITMEYHENVEFQGADNKDQNLEFVELSDTNRNIFKYVHNSAFLNSPNGSILSDEEIDDILSQCSDGLHFAGIGYISVIPAAVYILEVRDNAGWIEEVGVDPSQQGQGIGRELVRYCINLLKAKNIKKIKLNVVDANNSAHRLYQSFGFEKTETHSIWFELK